MDGALGLGSLTQSVEYVDHPTLVPLFLDLLEPVAHVACGGDSLSGAHSAVVTATGTVFTWGTGVALGIGSVRGSDVPKRVELEQPIVTVECGAGFCVALARGSGTPLVWGKWQDGRLGLGAAPVVHRQPRRHGARIQRKQYQLRPRAMTGVALRHVACGDAHCVAVTKGGTLVTWGRGSSGQLGNGGLDSAAEPVPVAVEFTTKCGWRAVAAGADWSLALDGDGRVWTWGACGAGAVGHNDGSGVSVSRRARVVETLLARHTQLRESGVDETAHVPQFDWLAPRPVVGLEGIDITNVAAGARHGAALSQTGDMFVWGDCIDDDRQDGVPRHVAVGDKSVAQIVCGGHRVMALVAPSTVPVHMRQLLETTSTTADVVLVVGGARVGAHSLILSRRSPVLRRLLVEQLATATTAVWPPEVLVPQLRADVAQLVLEFLHTDALTLPPLLGGRDAPAAPAIVLARDLQRAAQELELPGLEALCARALQPWAVSSSVDQADQEERSLSQALLGLLEIDQTADVALVAADDPQSPVLAHRCVLAACSEQLRALIASHSHVPGQTRVPISGSRRAVLSVVHFIYSGRFVPTDAEQDDLLQALALADAFGLDQLKLKVELALVVTSANCWRMLRIADKANARHLRFKAVAVARRHLSASLSHYDGTDPQSVQAVASQLRTAARADRVLSVRSLLSISPA